MSRTSTHAELSEPGREQLTALLSGQATAHVIVDDMDAGDIAAIAAHPDVSWKLLSAQPDRDAAIRLLEHRFQAALVSGQPDVIDLVRADLESIELQRDAARDLAIEELALRALTSLAWLDPMPSFILCQKYATNHAGERMAAVYHACHQVLTVAPLYKRLETEGEVPGPLARFVRLQWVASQDVLDELITELRRDITARTDVYLEVFDAMAERYTGLLRHIMRLTERFLPEAPPSLGELGEDERRRLGAALGEIDAPMRKGLRFVHLSIGVLTAGALLSLGGYDDAALGTMIVLGLASVAYSAWTERGMYSRLVRRPLAAYLAEVGTPTNCVVTWLLTNRKAVKKIKAYDVAIDADAALAAIARLGRMTRLHSEPAGAS